MPTKPQTITISLSGQPQSHQIQIGERTLAQLGTEALRCLGPTAHRIVIVSNRRVHDLYGATAKSSLTKAGFSVTSWLLGDGERFKTIATAAKALEFFKSIRLDRTDAVVGLGGGVVGDLAGFAAATYLRGIPIIHVPTTIIAQIDSSIGGKTGVNLPHGKNLVGAFHQPRSVFIDVHTLKTLPRREFVAGMYEAVKNGAVGGRDLFDQTLKFLDRDRSDPGSLIRFIKAHCAFKARIVKEDEREDPLRQDGRSRRILNFGHTVGHALETVTNYKRFRHGEAVGHGMLVAGEISKSMGLLAPSELESLRDALGKCGVLPRANDLDPAAILNLVRSDKKSVRGDVRWVLLEKIGKPRIVAGREIPQRLIREALQRTLTAT